MSLPAGWTDAALKDIVAINPANPDAVPSDDTLVSFVPMAMVQALTGRLDPSKHRPWREVKKGFSKFQEGDVVVAKITPSMENGKAAIAHGLANDLGAGTTELHVLRPREGLEPRFLLHYVLQESFRRQARARMTGTAGQLRVPTAFLEEQRIPLPPTAEQTRLVETLESMLSRLDAATGNLEAAQRKLKACRASVLKAAVEGRLVPTEADLARTEGRSYETADVLLQRIHEERRQRWEQAELVKMKTADRRPKDDRWKAKYEEPPSPECDGLPKLPEGWRWVTMGVLIHEQQNGLYVPASRYGSGTPILRIDDYQWEWSRSAAELKQVAISSDDAQKYGLRINDIVLNRVNSMTHLGKAFVISDRHVPAVFESNMMRIELLSNVSPYFVQLYLSSSLGRSRLTKNAKWAVNQASINQSDVALCAVPLPPLAEQMRIVAEVERLLSVATASADTLSANSKRCTVLRQSVLKWAFAGRLVDQNCGEESAESLLARIRAQRAALTPVKQRRSRNMRSAS